MKSLTVSERYGWSKYIAHQAYYSLLHRDYEWELMPLAIDQHIGTIVWSPLSSGKLTGKYRRGKPLPKDARVAQGGNPRIDESEDVTAVGGYVGEPASESASRMNMP